MEDWQEGHITSNLTALLEYTICHPILLAELQAADVLGSDDAQQIEAKLTKHDKSKKLYDIIVTRKNGYKALIKALLKGSQSAAYDILAEGVLNQGLPQMKIVLSKDVIRLSRSLDKDSIEKLKALKEAYGTDKFIHMILNFQTNENPLKLVKYGTPNPLTYYIPRTMTNSIYFKQDTFNNSRFKDLRDVFVFKNIKRPELSALAGSLGTALSSSQLIQVNSRFILLEKDEHWDRVRQRCKSPIHLIRYVPELNNFMLEASQGNSEIISNIGGEHLQGIKRNTSEEEFIKNQGPSQVNSGACVCDTPGMGKSILLANLANKISVEYPDHVVMFLSFEKLLASFTSTRPSITREYNVFNIIIQEFATSELAKDILRLYFKIPGKRLNLFLDGFDELSQEDAKWTKLFLKSLLEESRNIKLYLTSRPHHRRELEKMLDVIAYEMLPFDDKTQEDFLVSYWKHKLGLNDDDSKLKKLKQLSSFCRRKLKEQLTTQDRDIMGTPLQCYLLAELYFDEAETVSEFDMSISEKNIPGYVSSIFKMYTKFLSMRFDSYEKRLRECQQSGDTSFPSTANMKNYHIWKAVALFFPEIASSYASENLNPMDQAEPDERHFSVGIMEARFDGQSTAEFIHRTIAEFILAEYVVDSIRGNQNSECFMLIIKSIFSRYNNHELKLRLPVHGRDGCDGVLTCTTFNFEYSVIMYFISEYLSESFPQNIPPNLLDTFVSSKNPGDSLYKFLSAATRQNLSSLISIPQMLLPRAEKRTYTTCKEYFTKPTIDYHRDGKKIEPANVLMCQAVELSNNTMLEKIRDFLDSCFRFSFREMCTTSRFKIATPLQLAVRKADYDLTEFLIQREFPTQDQSLLFLCIEDTQNRPSGNVNRIIEICRLLQTKNPNITNETIDGGNGLSCVVPMLIDNISMDVLKFLAGSGARSYQFNQGTQRQELNDTLLKFINNLPKCCSSKYYHRTVESLLKIGLGHIFKMTDNEGWTPPFLAVELIEILPKTLELLAGGNNDNGKFSNKHSLNIDLNAVTRNKRTILHVAVMRGCNISFLKYLIKYSMGEDQKYQLPWYDN